MPVAIAVSNLTKIYGRSKVAAVDGVTLAVKSGEVYGFLGANGAGKSTTIRTIMGFLRPSSGSIELLGRDASDKNVSLHDHVGYLAGDVVLPKHVTGRKILAYLSDLNGSVDASYQKQLVDRFEAQLDIPSEQLSKGNRQKIGIIQAFMHQPDAIILDEPTSGLDPLMQEQFYNTVEEACARGAAVLLSSHSFDEVERVCDRIGIIRKGKLVYQSAVAQMVAASAPRWRVTLKHDSDAPKLASDPAIKLISTSKRMVIVEPAKSIDSALGALSKFPIVSMTTYQREIEEEFMSLYGDKEEANS